MTTVTPAPDQSDGENEPGLHPTVPLPPQRQPATGEIAYLLGCDDTNSFYRRLRDATEADELIITTITHDHANRVRSYQLLAEEWARR